ncbi:probable cytochrome P450 6d5 [Contarinia nasturtii]|uniref:probable cytochrome P450 6d5 n=1 Tax=Contarinia nasturtii TaxID=265458 RepID=UPI0012D3E410|nr:probable cytochrome P450 6d5 [Contarinia nasturtii]
MSFSSGSLKCDAMLLLISAITLFYLYLKRNYSYWDRKGFKTHPGAIFILGHSKSNFMGKEQIGCLTRKIYNKTSEAFIGFYILLRPVLLLRDPDLIRTILIKDFSHFPDRGLYCNEKDDPLTGNLVALPGQKWRNLRAKLTPTFTSGKLKAMFSTLVECGSTLQDYLEKLADKKELLDVREIAASHTTNVIASVGFGIEIDTITNPDNEFRKYGRKIFSSTLKSSLRRSMAFGAPKIMKFFRIKSVDSDVERFIMSVVRENLEYREKNNVVRRDFFQLLIDLRNTGTVELDDHWDSNVETKSIQNQELLTLNEIGAQSFIFFAAGFETSSSTLSFCLYELAKNQKIQNRVYDEINRVLDGHGGKITYDAVSEMKYLEHCIDETLRKYPIATNLVRICMENYKIPGSNRTIEKGVEVIIPILALHRDEKYYENPNKFDPDRFNEENLAGKNQSNRPYYPFGDGPRNCIGMRLGKMQTKVGLVMMLQQFRYDLENELERTREMEFEPRSNLLAPRGGIRLYVFKR